MKGWSFQAVVTGGSSEPRRIERVVPPSPSSSSAFFRANNGSDTTVSYPASGIPDDSAVVASAMAEMFGSDSKEEDDEEEEDGEDVWRFPDSTHLKYAQLDPSNPVHRKKLMSLRFKNCGVLDFHNGSEDALICFVERNAIKGNPQSVLNAIDIFGYARHWMMHASHTKVPYIHKAVSLARKNIQRRLRLFDSKQEQNQVILDNDDETLLDTGIELDDYHAIPLVCLEIGSYCGYSTIAIASQLAPGGMLYCLELHPKCAAWTSRMVALAGLSDRVKIIQGAVDDEVLESLRDLLTADLLRLSSPSMAASPASPLRHELEQPGIDMLFIDHEKTMYLQDLMMFESSKLLRKGSVVVADNVLSFGKPLTTYLSHVRGPPPTVAQQGLTHRSPKSSPSHATSTPPPHSPHTPSTLQHTASQKTVSSMSNFSLSPTSPPPTSPIRHGIYSSSQCYKCFVEYSRYEMYDETIHSDAPEVDGVEISVYGVEISVWGR